MNKKIKNVLIIGSGPVVIGQASEYDYCGVQACKALKEENIRVIVINSNPASMITDKDMADAIYIEPLNVDVVKRVIAIEKPDSILPTMGGDIGFEIALELYQSGFLDNNNILLLSVNVELISTIKDRSGLKQILAEMNEPSVDSEVFGNVEDSVNFAAKIGLPIIIRPAFELREGPDEICYTIEEVKVKAEKALLNSMLHQILIEKCISGWKEIEYEVIRDIAGNCICISSMENLDPVGIHTGDSIIVTPAQTLTDAESLQLRASALNVISHLSIQGSCGIQFALEPQSGEYAVISVNPRLSRSSALVSKATGYPIASVAAKVAVGYKLFEIINDITGCTTACNEPAIDYCAIKFPKWSFEKFDHATRKLGASMQATGETISFGTSFELAFMKAIRSINIGISTPSLPKLISKSDAEIIETIINSDDERIFAVYEAIKRNISFNEIFELTKIDRWFLAKLRKIAEMELKLYNQNDEDTYHIAKRMGFLDETIKVLSGSKITTRITPSYKMIDTCAAEFDAVRPYFYSAFDDENETHMFSDLSTRGKKKVLVIGSGPATIGHGGELDYCNVHCLHALNSLGYSTILANNNLDAVSTDYRLSDRLYIDPICVEDILNLIETEQPWGVITQFSGEKVCELTAALNKTPIKLLGVNNELIEALVNKELLRNKLESIKIPFVSDLIFNSIGIEVDVICDGSDCLIPGISEHVERSGINSGDSISVCPPINISDRIKKIIIEISCNIAKIFELNGIFNIQMSLYDNKVYVSNISTSSFHNIPFISKSTGLPIIEIAVSCMLGEKLNVMGYGTGLYPNKDLFAVRVPVFSFDKIKGTDTQLGHEMKSTGEVLGIAKSFEDALLKGLIASGMRIKRSGGVLITVRNSDKQDAIVVADKFSQLDFNLYATAGTAKTLNSNFVASSSVRKLHEGSPHVLDLINGNKIVYVISTSEKSNDSSGDDIRIRRRAIERQIPTFTTLDTANALTRCLAKKRSLEDIEILNISKI
ncbi:MAG: carbamoyl phosphate synthase large subunit [Eubacteriales bacterium]